MITDLTIRFARDGYLALTVYVWSGNKIAASYELENQSADLFVCLGHLWAQRAAKMILALNPMTELRFTIEDDAANYLDREGVLQGIHRAVEAVKTGETLYEET